MDLLADLKMLMQEADAQNHATSQDPKHNTTDEPITSPPITENTALSSSSPQTQPNDDVTARDAPSDASAADLNRSAESLETAEPDSDSHDSDSKNATSLLDARLQLLDAELASKLEAARSRGRAGLERAGKLEDKLEGLPRELSSDKMEIEYLAVKLKQDLVHWSTTCEELNTLLTRAKRESEQLKAKQRELKQEVKKLNVLIVEDDPFQAESILMLCEQCEYKAQLVDSGEMAIKRIQQDSNINLVLTGMDMAGMTGYDLLMAIRKEDQSISVVFISAYESIDLVEQCILSGADAYLMKPLRVPELRHIWQYVWRRRHESTLAERHKALVHEHAEELGVSDDVAPGGRQGMPPPAASIVAAAAADSVAVAESAAAQAEAQEVSHPRLRHGARRPSANTPCKGEAHELSQATRQLEMIEISTQKCVSKSVSEQLNDLVKEGRHDKGVHYSTLSTTALPSLAEVDEMFSEGSSTLNDDRGGAGISTPPRNSSNSPLSMGSSMTTSFTTRSQSYKSTSAGSVAHSSDHSSSESLSKSPSIRNRRTCHGNVGESVCRLCERFVPMREMQKHIVWCTANQSCQEQLRSSATKMRQLSSRIRLRRARISEMIANIGDVVKPLKLINALIDEATGIMASDPISHVYKLTEIRDRLRETFRGVQEPVFNELIMQTEAMLKLQIDAQWDLLSLHDPKEMRKKAKKVSIRDFDLVKLIGKGGFGSVWLSSRKSTGDLVAIKVISKRETAAHKMIKSVMLEKDIIQLAKSPYMVHLYFSFTTVNHLYMVMEYCPSGDCFQLLESLGFLEVEVARFFIGETLCGLEALHLQGVIHRDIKPQNMLLTATGHIKLADFGLSAASEASAPEPIVQAGDGPPVAPKTARRPERHNSLEKGTADYLAPEILLRTGHDASVDFWAVGVVLYQFVVGETPFDAPDTQGVFRRIVKCECDFPDADDVTEELADLLPRLIERDPKLRLGSVGGVEDIKEHPFFAMLDWSVELHEQESPYTPPQPDTEISKALREAQELLEAESLAKELSDDDDEQEGSGQGAFSGFDSFNSAGVARAQLRELSKTGSGRSVAKMSRSGSDLTDDGRDTDKEPDSPHSSDSTASPSRGSVSGGSFTRPRHAAIGALQNLPTRNNTDKRTNSGSFTFTAPP